MITSENKGFNLGIAKKIKGTIQVFSGSNELKAARIFNVTINSLSDFQDKLDSLIKTALEETA